MDEDDTYRILKRIPFSEMKHIFDGTKDYAIAIAQLTKNGWTVEEYRDALIELSQRRIQDTREAQKHPKSKVNKPVPSEIGQNCNDFWNENKILRSTK